MSTRQVIATPPTFDVTGSVDGLYPGASRQLPVELTNPYAAPMLVTVIDVDVGDGGTNCPAELLMVSDLGEPVVVDAGATGVAELVVTLDASAPDACQGATFPLRYRAIASVDGDVAVVTTTTAPAGAAAGDPGGDGPGGSLVPTGSTVAPILGLASVLVGIGVVLRRRRRRPEVRAGA